jgi:hypothetical protein
MDDSVSFIRLTIVAIVAIAIWFLSTFVPSPYEIETAQAPADAVRQASGPESLSDVPMPDSSPLAHASVNARLR